MLQTGKNHERIPASQRNSLQKVIEIEIKRLNCQRAQIHSWKAFVCSLRVLAHSRRKNAKNPTAWIHKRKHLSVRRPNESFSLLAWGRMCESVFELCECVCEAFPTFVGTSYFILYIHKSNGALMCIAWEISHNSQFVTYALCMCSVCRIVICTCIYLFNACVNAHAAASLLKCAVERYKMLNGLYNQFQICAE